MYYDHFGLKEAPFKITPNTDFFYSGANRGAVLEALMYAIVTGEGIIKVVGEVGSGKTMLCRMLQDQLPESVENIYLANPSVAPEDILHVLAFELQLKLPKNADRIKVMQLLQDHLIKRHAEGKKVVIFVEEAQGMPIETLEEIRLLTNLETKQDKLLQIVLFGQPELDENLNQNKIRQLRERITHSFYLSPFDKADIEPYIEYRLRKAGYAGPPLFTPDALKLLSRASEGLVRRANILADKALLSTFSENTYQVGRKNVLAAIKDSEFSREMGKSHMIKKWLIAFAMLLILVGLIGGMLTAWQNNQLAIQQFLSDVKHQALPSNKPKTETKPDTQKKPNTSAVMPTSQANTITSSAGGYDPKAELIVSATTESTPTKTAPSSEAVNNQINTTITKPTEVKPVEAKPVEAKPNEANTANSNEATPIGNNTSAEQTTTNAVPAITQPVLSDALMSKINASKIWFNEQSASTVTIQLMGLPATQVESQLNVVAKHLDIENIHLYQKVVKGQPFVTLVYGSYTSKAEATAAIETLPAFIQSNAPYIRTIGGILKETKHLQ